MPPGIRDVRHVWEGRVWIDFFPCEEVAPGAIDEGDVHMSAISRETLARLGHEAGRNSVLASDGTNNVFEQICAIGHIADLAKCQSGLEDAGPGLGVPGLNVRFEFLACVENAVVVVFVLHGARQGIAEHAFGEGGQGVDWVGAQEGRGGGVVALVCVAEFWVWGRAELVELVFS